MNGDLERLVAAIAPHGSALVALSGGVDSALVARVARLHLRGRMVAITAVGSTIPEEEVAIARGMAVRFGWEHRLVDTREVDRPGYRANAGDRCFHCKSALFETTEAIRVEEGLAVVLDGTLPDDLTGHRPGHVAAHANGVRHPLVEAGLSKGQVRELARSLDLPVWDKPSFACLGSRFPRGTEVTEAKLRRVDVAERALRAEGLKTFRVRWHELGDRVLARVEVAAAEIAIVAQPDVRNRVATAMRGVGVDWVTLDLLGYGQTADGS